VTEMSDDDPRVDELFALAPEDFTAARNTLVRQLRADGHRDLAAEVATLRRPTVAAWAVNQAVRAHGAAFEDLVAAGAAVRTAQRRALSGVAGGMRSATRRRREQIERLTDLAVQVLDDHGVASAAHRGDIAATFDAASADDAAAARVRRARLAQTLPVSSDFDALEGLTVLTNVEPATAASDGSPLAPGDDGATEPGTGRSPDDAAAEAARQEAALARRRAIRAVSDARRRLTDARQEADRAVAEAERAEARAAAADQTATAAEDKARRLRDDADERAARAAAARARAGEAERSAQRSVDELEAAQRELDALG
jgi:hypothetical protein